MILSSEIWIVFTICESLVVQAAPVKPCRLGADLLNGLVNTKNKDEEEYGIENTFGLVGNDPGNETDKQELSSKEFQDCIQQYLQNTTPTKPNEKFGSSNLHYEKLPNFGNPLAIPVPIPQDEDYLPGAEGYTTYINPHNFKEKLSSGKEKEEEKKKKKKKKKKKEKLDKSSEEKLIDELISIFEDDDDDDWI